MLEGGDASTVVGEGVVDSVRVLRSRLRHCPEAYYENCRQAQVSCRVCGAGFGGVLAPVRYEPRDEGLSPHPYEERRQRRLQARALRRQRAMAARRHERVETMRLGRRLARQTLASGAVGHDGDAQLLQGLLQVDYKVRSGQHFRLRYEEYESGLRQGTNVWHLTLRRPDGQRLRLVCVTVELFERLVGYASGDTGGIGEGVAQ